MQIAKAISVPDSLGTQVPLVVLFCTTVVQYASHYCTVVHKKGRDGLKIERNPISHTNTHKKGGIKVEDIYWQFFPFLRICG